MFHVCIFTDVNNEKFIPVGGFSEFEIQNSLNEAISKKFGKRTFPKLVIFKSFMMDEEGEVYLNYITKFEQKDLIKLVASENVTFSDQSKHLANQ
jgi:acyl CoA:acetate/3-ketoacid CoA transferase